MTGTERERRRKTIIAAMFLLALLGVGLWVASAIAERQALERCLASRRRDCGEVGAKLPDATPRSYAPTR